MLAREEVGVLRRNTLVPRQDFIVLRLEPGAIATIFKQIMAAGLKRAITHVQIEREGVLQLGAYDNFYPGCVVTRPGVSAGLLSELQSAGSLRGFQATVVSQRGA